MKIKQTFFIFGLNYALHQKESRWTAWANKNKEKLQDLDQNSKKGIILPFLKRAINQPLSEQKNLEVTLIRLLEQNCKTEVDSFVFLREQESQNPMAKNLLEILKNRRPEPANLQQKRSLMEKAKLGHK